MAVGTADESGWTKPRHGQPLTRPHRVFTIGARGLPATYPLVRELLCASVLHVEGSGALRAALVKAVKKLNE